MQDGIANTETRRAQRPDSGKHAPIPEHLESAASAVIGAAIEVHRRLGPGLLESVYERCLIYELDKRGVGARTQVSLPIRYDGMELDAGYRIDLLIEEGLVVELKAVEKVLPIHKAQLMTYLRLGGYRLGLIINFFVPLLKDGITRRVN